MFMELVLIRPIIIISQYIGKSVYSFDNSQVWKQKYIAQAVKVAEFPIDAKYIVAQRKAEQSDRKQINEIQVKKAIGFWRPFNKSGLSTQLTAGHCNAGSRPKHVGSLKRFTVSFRFRFRAAITQ